MKDNPFPSENTSLSANKTHTPFYDNEETLAAIAESHTLLRDPDTKGYHSMEDLKAVLDE